MVRYCYLTLSVAVLSFLLASTRAEAQSFPGDGWLSAGTNGLAWTRTDPMDGSAIIPGLSTSDADFNWEPGVEGWLTFQPFEGEIPLGADFRYFWMHEFSASDTAVFNPGIIPPLQFDLELQSELQGSEASAMCLCHDRFTLLGGFRWIRLEEQLTVASGVLANPGTNGTIYQPLNDLYGFQFGSNASVLEMNNFRLNLLTKMGVYQNQHDHTRTLFTPAGTAVATETFRDTAWSAEGRLGATYWFGRCVAITAGYQVLYLDGVMRAETMLLSTATTQSDDSLLYHGGYAGITIFCQ